MRGGCNRVHMCRYGDDDDGVCTNTCDSVTVVTTIVYVRLNRVVGVVGLSWDDTALVVVYTHAPFTT